MHLTHSNAFITSKIEKKRQRSRKNVNDQSRLLYGPIIVVVIKIIQSVKVSETKEIFHRCILFYILREK